MLVTALHACFVPGCGPAERPSVILVTIDTLRPDRLSAYGYRKQRTPSIDAFARDGALFEHAVCDVPWTSGSMASVFTGRYATYHGIRLGVDRLSDEAVTLAEVLRDHGWRTAAVIGSFPVASHRKVIGQHSTNDYSVGTGVIRIGAGGSAA